MYDGSIYATKFNGNLIIYNSLLFVEFIFVLYLFEQPCRICIIENSMFVCIFFNKRFINKLVVQMSNAIMTSEHILCYLID